MVNVAIIGYEFFPHDRESGDLVVYIPDELEGDSGLHFCHVDVVERRTRGIYEMVDEMLATGPDVVHYANYRDPYQRGEGHVDRPYIERVLETSDIPVLLTSALPEAEDLADELGVHFLSVPFMLQDYIDTVRKLAGKGQ